MQIQQRFETKSKDFCNCNLSENNMQTSPHQQQLTQQKGKFCGFKQWFKAHGGLQRDINFPVRFEPGDYLGISAKTQITPNTVILAVPKQLVVSVSRARQSQLKQIYQKYEIFGQKDNEDADYNVLCLYLIMQKMKGTQSFFHPYIQLLDSSQTVMNWTNPQIQSINDPYINIKFIDSIRATFQPIYQTFLEITQQNKDLFPQLLTRKKFDQMYAAVMTRGFGWGLPQTMLVPYADFLNHSSTGVNHYVFDRCLEDSNQETSYIKKKYELNLSLFPSMQNQILPIDYQPNLRQSYIHKNLDKLKQMNLISKDSIQQTRLDPTITNPLYNMLTQPIIQQNFDDSIYLSTDSQDNDSDSEAQGLQESDQIDGKGQPTANKLGTVLMARKYLRYAFKLVDKDLDERFTEPKPNVNAEFEEGVKFDWWWVEQHHKAEKALNNQKYQEKQKKIEQQQYPSKYFIVSTSRKLYPNQQIYNCYGRRSNRFLLIWYGFCFQHNKYDSVPFRLWSSQITKRTGHSIYTRFLTQTEYRQGIPIGNQRFNAYMLSQEFRLKSRRVDHKLMAFLRYRFLSANRVYKEHYKLKEWHVNRVTAIHMEIECWLEYQRCLNTLKSVFGVEDKGYKKGGGEGQIQKNTKQEYPSARQYFKSILQKSNQQIIIKNILAVNQILRTLYQLQTHLQKQQNNQQKAQKSQKSFQEPPITWQPLPKQLLLQLYQTTYNDSEKQHPFLYERLDLVSGRSSSTIRKQLKLMIREYFRILSKSEVCRTMYTEFR